MSSIVIRWAPPRGVAARHPHRSCMLAFRATADEAQPLVLDDELLEAKWWDRSAVRKACGVPGAVMSPDVAKEAFATDPSLELLVPPKKVVARELIEAWLSEVDTVNN